MEAYEYKAILLNEVRGRARAEALLVADIGDLPAGNETNTAQVYDHYRRVVDGVISRYERGGAAPNALIAEMAEAYCAAFKKALEGTWMKGRADLDTAKRDWQDTMRIPYIAVEFDESFWGGDYDQAGALAKIPVAVLEGFGGNMKLAFRQVTGLDPAHIIHWSPDEVYIDDEHGIYHEYEEENDA